MNDCIIDTHLIIIIMIIIIAGAFGGYLNYLHNFDTNENESKDHNVKMKYIMLGIGAAILVPAFLKMISSNLACSTDNNDYLIFTGFCLTAAIFSRKFITTIGEKILEAAKKAEKTSQENKQKIETTQQELSSTKERIEDVKLVVDINNAPVQTVEQGDKYYNQIIELANNYIERTSIPNYSDRLKLKSELGRRMAEIILRNNLSSEKLLKDNQSEGMLMAIAYSIQLKPDSDDLDLLIKISKIASQLYTKYTILVAYDTLARNNFLQFKRVHEIQAIVLSFKHRADIPLLNKIRETLNILSFIVE